MSTSEDLSQQSSLDGLVSWNWSSKTIHKIVNNSLRGWNPGETIQILFTKSSFTISQWCLEPIFLQDSERDQVRVGLKYRLKGSSGSADFSSLTTIQTHNLNSIARPHSINVIIVTENAHRSWSLALWHVFWQLLDLYKLLIGELTVFMHKKKCLAGLTTGTNFRLLHFSINEINGNFSLALDTLECSSFHFRINLTASDHNSSERNESVDIFLL